jgi:hypothetical protein
LAHEFSHRLLSEHITHGTLENIHNEFERNYSGGNFKKPYEALRKAFQR